LGVFEIILTSNSAVDAHVGKYILEECLTGQLKERTRILVTHKIESLRYVDYIYIFKSGQIVAEGSLDEIKKSAFYQEIEQNATKEAKNEETEDQQLIKKEEESSLKEEDTTENTVIPRKGVRGRARGEAFLGENRAKIRDSSTRIFELTRKPR